MGALARENLGMADGYFQHTPQNIDKIIKVIRTYQPDIVLANSRQDRHPDHGRAGKLIADACFYSGLRKIDTGQDVWRPRAVYHYVQDRSLSPDFVVDISDYIDHKKEVMMAYASQLYNPELDKTEPSTAISTPAFLESIWAQHRIYGRPIGAEFAEAFTVNRYLISRKQHEHLNSMLSYVWRKWHRSD